MKKFSLVMCAFILCVLSAVTLAGCGNNPNWISVDSEDTLAEALNNKSSHIRLTEDISLSSVLNIGNSCSIDLNTHTLTLDASNDNTKTRQAVVRVDGKTAEKTVDVTIENGKLVKSSSGNAVATAVQSVYNSKLNLKGVEVVSDSQGVIASYGSTLNLDNCKVESKWQTIGTNNTQPGKGNTISATNSDLVSTSDVSVFVSNYTKLNISKSKIKGLTGMHILLGDINVTDSEIIATSSYNPYTSGNVMASGTKENEGSAIVVRANHYYDSSYKTNDLNLNFTNNTITTTSGVDVTIYDLNNTKGFIPSTAEANLIVNSSEKAENYFADKDLTVKVYRLNNGTLSLVENA